MKKFRVLFLALACCVLLAACESGDKQTPKIGVVDVNSLMKDSAPGKEALKFIETQQASLQAELDKIQDRLEKNPGDANAMKELQKVYALSQQRIQTEGQSIVGALFDAIQGVIDNFRSANGFALLVRVEALDSFDPLLNMTSQLMTEVNKLKLDFAAISKAAAAQADQAIEAPANPDEKKDEPASETPAPEDAAKDKK